MQEETVERFQQTLILSIILALGLAACAAPGTPSAADADRTRPAAAAKRMALGIIGDPAALFPGIDQRQATPTGGIANLVNVSLTIADQEDILYPRLAREVPSTENGLWKVFPDGTMETTWRLREGTTWHDGMPLTAEDFLFSLRVYQDRELPFASTVVYSYIDGATAPDPRTLLVRWNRLFVDADGFSPMPMPKHLVEDTYLSAKDRLLDMPLWSTEMVGSGPYKVRQFERASHAIFEAFGGFVLGRPKIDTLEVRFFQEPNLVAANLLAGTIDGTMGRGLSIAQAVEMERQWPNGKIAPHVYKSWIRIHPQFIDPNPAVILEAPFRQALLHAIDRQQIVDTIQQGVGAIAETPPSISSPYYRTLAPYVVQYPYDPRKATQLLEGVGSTRGPDGFFVDGAGQKLSVEIRAGVRVAAQVSSMTVVADDWQRVGVAVRQTVVPDQLQGDREYRQTRCCFEVNRGGAEMNALTAFHGRGIQTYENSFRGVGSLNYPRYGHPELDTLIDRYQMTIPIPERLAVAGQIIQHMTSRVVQMGLFYDVEPAMVANRLINFPGNHWNAHEWDVKS